MKPLEHWERIAHRWRHMGSPLRPCSADVRHFTELLELAPSRPLRVLILGVTPELFRIHWPRGTAICSADRSAEMIQAIWPGPTEAAFLAEWLALPFDDASFDRVLCDGGLHLLGYPDDHRNLSQSVTRVLSPGGRFLIRLFARPAECETASVVLRDLFAGTCGNFHAFKLRLAMALQSSPATGIILDQVYRHVLDAVGSLDRLSESTGWPIEKVATLQSYLDSRNVYHFLSEAESIEALTAGGNLALERRLEGCYLLGERCPLLSLRKVTGMEPETEVVNRLIEGFRQTALIAAAVRTGLLERMQSAPCSAGELATELELHQPSVRRVLRGLAVLRLVSESIGAGEVTVRYGLTPVGRMLHSEATNSLACYARLCGQQYLPAWMHLESALRSGELPFRAAFGTPVWQFRQTHPEEGALFDQWLHGQSSTVVDSIVRAYDFAGCRTVVDIAGGKGALLTRVLTNYPAIRGVLADQSSVLAGAHALLRENNLSERCDLVPIDFFASIPAGCDTYLLKSVLHDWQDEDCVKILNTVRQALTPRSRLLLIERLLPDFATDDPSTIWMDLHMMCVTGGCERSAAQYSALLESSGLRRLRTIATEGPFSILEIAQG